MISTAWKILFTESKTEILKDHFTAVGKSGKKSQELKNAFEKYSKTDHVNCY